MITKNLLEVENVKIVRHELKKVKKQYIPVINVDTNAFDTL
jgi:hypothetical protein